MNLFKLTENEQQQLLAFIENNLLFIENTFLLNNFRNIIKHNIIPEITNINEEQQKFIENKKGPYIYMVNWTPVGFRYMIINQLDECKNFTDEHALEMCYNTHKELYYDKTRNKTYTYNELLQIRPFTLLFMETGIGRGLRVVCNATNESKDITDYKKW